MHNSIAIRITYCKCICTKLNLEFISSWGEKVETNCFVEWINSQKLYETSIHHTPKVVKNSDIIAQSTHIRYIKLSLVKTLYHNKWFSVVFLGETTPWRFVFGSKIFTFFTNYFWYHCTKHSDFCSCCLNA